MLSEDELEMQLEGLFRETGQAHHREFAETDGADPEWPLFYATYLEGKLGSLLGAKLTRSELVFLILLASKEQALEAPGSDWAPYYARWFARRYA